MGMGRRRRRREETQEKSRIQSGRLCLARKDHDGAVTYLFNRTMPSCIVFLQGGI